MSVYYPLFIIKNLITPEIKPSSFYRSDKWHTHLYQIDIFYSKATKSLQNASFASISISDSWLMQEWFKWFLSQILIYDVSDCRPWNSLDILKQSGT